MATSYLHSSTETRRGPETRKTRIVCISDTHNQTPKLPAGDVLIHAGDLTNQGSYSELQKTVEWLEKSDFEAKIIIAGNHDITLDAPFYHSHGKSWRWPKPQDPAACRELLISSPSITYLENEATTIKLTSPKGPKTYFTVFGSPCTPKHSNWAFQYDEHDAAEVWRKISDGVDVVVTHTPPKELCDGATNDDRSGCPALTKRLWEVKPVLSVCGHIHAGRGVERVRWGTNSDDVNSLVDSIEYWTDPGKGNKKLSLVDLTKKTGRALGYHGGGLTRQHVHYGSLRYDAGGQPDAALSLPQDEGLHQPRSGDEKLIPASSLTNFALCRNEALLRGNQVGKAMDPPSDVGPGSPDKAAFQPEIEDGRQRKRLAGNVERKETVVVNAAYLGPRVAGKAVGFNKPIVVDVDLPVWKCEVEIEVG
ncbi:Metallo-dependent phosphatase [Cucurbitaria berberidis CBS 394.84]|uniref:Metallo-dependent phosphatase n=1 Tax=Cucurbitaria berberidis CBS 394.84 TaxID=1168544 RepID=A0A9P4GCK5_9PLEO|nr:Metallo-dependent phosphatase [Cucurbitaria berberidis CBS 394.84]KAF1842861.1 Metallo-dependent phosphatase [Cucurbitaria berberidis CBS 394.84]